MGTTWPIKGKCQVCSKTPLALGINSTATLTICEECDKRNNPYYYTRDYAAMMLTHAAMLESAELIVSARPTTDTVIDCPPPLFKAYYDGNVYLDVFTTIEAAQQALDDILDDYHESIAFEADHHHQALDIRFKRESRIVIE